MARPLQCRSWLFPTQEETSHLPKETSQGHLHKPKGSSPDGSFLANSGSVFSSRDWLQEGPTKPITPLTMQATPAIATRDSCRAPGPGPQMCITPWPVLFPTASAHAQTHFRPYTHIPRHRAHMSTWARRNGHAQHTRADQSDAPHTETTMRPGQRGFPNGQEAGRRPVSLSLSQPELSSQVAAWKGEERTFCCLSRGCPEERCRSESPTRPRTRAKEL